jgi:hypothetical protein
LTHFSKIGKMKPISKKYFTDRRKFYYEKEPRRKKRFHISDLETLRAIADPLRVQIMELLEGQTLTVKQVAEKLGLAQASCITTLARSKNSG